MFEKIIIEPFGIYEGKKINKYTLTDASGIKVSIINYGATITNIYVPDNKNKEVDVVLGFNTLEGYINAGDYYMGSICGRYANRLANGSFSILDKKTQVSQNNHLNCLHGGLKGFDKMFWEAEVGTAENAVIFSYVSKDGEEGFPGNLNVQVTYRIQKNELHIEYLATTDKNTPINLTSHCYFNLSGGNSATILEHDLQLNANKFIEVDQALIPTGKIKNVENTLLDFTTQKKIGLDIDASNGFDYSWVLNSQKDELFEASQLIFKKNGIVMKIFTTEPAIHFYSGTFLTDKIQDTKNNIQYNKYAGLCLEAQHFPDSPNNNHFPNTILKPGEQYKQRTIYQFEIL
jgi:aldose 1-epimerase